MDYSAAVRNYGNIVTRVGTGPILERSADGRGHFLTSNFFSQISEINQVFGTVSKAWPLSTVRFNSPRHRQIDFIHCRMANKNCALDISDILILKEKVQKYVLSSWDILECQNLCCGSYTVFWHTLNSYHMSFTSFSANNSVKKNSICMSCWQRYDTPTTDVFAISDWLYLPSLRN